MFTLAAVTSVGIYLILMRIGMRKVMRFGAGVDILTSIGLIFLASTTFSGLMVAAISGAMLSGMLFTTRLFVKPAKLSWFPIRSKQ